MTGVLDRLTDAMSAAAGSVREEELRPLDAPLDRRRGLAGGRRRRSGHPARRRWWQSAWAAPIGTAAAVVLAIGLAAAMSNELSGTGQPAGPGPLPVAPHRFYVATDLTGNTVVRSTATGKVTATVPVPSLQTVGWSVAPEVAAAAGGTFYVAAFERGRPDEQIFWFRLTGAGQVTGFARMPGGSLRRGWVADSLAASPDGSLVAVGAYYEGSVHYQGPGRSDQLVVIHSSTGAQSVWRGGEPASGYKHFGVASLSWTASDHKLAVLGEWCRVASGPGGEGCPRWERLAQLRTINPAGRGGSVLAGHLLLAQSSRYSYIAQALINPGGSVITAMLLHGPVVGTGQVSGMFPDNLTVERISVTTGRQLGVLYQRHLGATTSVSGGMADPLTLAADPAGRGLILNGGICDPGCGNVFNGWLRDGRLISLLPTGFASREAVEAW
jgi:hypothetical protein